MAETPQMSEQAQRAIAALKAGDLDNAVPQLRQAVADDPSNWLLRQFLGIALGKVDKWQDAERQFSEAYDLNGSSADAAYYLGVAIAKQGRLREAHGMFNVAIQVDPEHKGAIAARRKTADAAAVDTIEGSSAAVPGGIGGIDFGNLGDDLLGVGGKKTGGANADVAAALSDYGGGGKGKAKAKPGGKASGGAKKAGCGSSLIGWLTFLTMLIAGLTHLF